MISWLRDLLRADVVAEAPAAPRQLPADRADSGDTLARQLNRQLKGPSPIIVNLASQEYFRAVHGQGLKARVIDCVFEDWKGGGYKVISFFAKRARGMMLRHAIAHRLDAPEGLLTFKAEGYRFEPSVSQADRLVFRRRIEG